MFYTHGYVSHVHQEYRPEQSADVAQGEWHGGETGPEGCVYIVGVRMS